VTRREGPPVRLLRAVDGPPVVLEARQARQARASVEWLIGILPGIERAALEADVVEVERLLVMAAGELSELRGTLLE
jgi:hypothetical protein